MFYFSLRFTWDEAKYPLMNPLRETVDTIQGNVAKLEDDLKVDQCNCSFLLKLLLLFH